MASTQSQVGQKFLPGMNCFKSAVDRSAQCCMKSNTPKMDPLGHVTTFFAFHLLGFFPEMAFIN